MQQDFNEYDFDPSTRNGNGVKSRMDGKGDAWSNAHRDGLGSRFLMQDVDANFGVMVFGQNSGERLFLEYVPDKYKNRTKAIRKFAVVAMFDRKLSERKAFDNSSLVSRAFYLWQCGTFAKHQPVAPKFFYVIGSDRPPWTMIELDITTGNETGQRVDIASNGSVEWSEVWAQLGLTGMREQLTKWMAA